MAVAAVAIVLLASLAARERIQSNRIAQERDRASAAAERAAREAETAEQVSEFLVGLFEMSDPSEARGNNYIGSVLPSLRQCQSRGPWSQEETLTTACENGITGDAHFSIARRSGKTLLPYLSGWCRQDCLCSVGVAFWRFLSTSSCQEQPLSKGLTQRRQASCQMKNTSFYLREV